ncbi:MAG TPA: hypothetical protein VNG53_02445, partial [Bacteroidia bacterium]|nr:hypothetical protein [Bacteroidia bacterium]
EDLDKKNREWYLNENRKNDLKKTFFILVRPKPPYSFDVVNYKTDCVVAYDENDNYDFRMLFALKISFTTILKMNDFLVYQLKKNFKNDKEKYFEFLKDVLMEHHKLIDSGKIEKTREYLNKFTTTDLPIKIDEKFDFPLKAYSPIELQKLYNVSPKTFSAWLKPFSREIGKLRGRKYTIKQVKVIFSKIDTPRQD